ncbi:EF-hand domain-containing protein [Dirofilaria immitis]
MNNQDDKKTSVEQHDTSDESATKYGPLLINYRRMESDRPDVLSFECYSFEPDTEVYSHRQFHHIQPMKLLYHLTDHTISLIEPHIPNNSILQDFLTKKGIEVNEEEEIPMEPWIRNQDKQQSSNKNKESEDGKFEWKREKVDYSDAPPKLHLLACWLDGTSVRTFHMIVHTIDDTVALVENTCGFSGQLFLKRNKLPFIKKDVRRFYHSNEIRPGLWVEVYTRPMFIFSCEGPETRNFLKRFGPIDFESYEKALLNGPPPEVIENIPSEMKFIALMVGGKGLFDDIKFLITFHTNKEKLDIAEAARDQKWCSGRTFIKDINCSRHDTDKYKIGSTLRIYRWNFLLLEADDITQQYLLSKES